MQGINFIISDFKLREKVYFRSRERLVYMLFMILVFLLYCILRLNFNAI